MQRSSFFLVAILNCLLAVSLAEYNCDSKKDGFYSDEDFCHIYWRCNYGMAEEYECPAGTAWNHIEQRCDWLDNVDCSRMDSEESVEGDDDDSDDSDHAKQDDYYSDDRQDEDEDNKDTDDNDDAYDEESIGAHDDRIDPVVDDNADEDDAAPKENNNGKDDKTVAPAPVSNACKEKFGSYYVADAANCGSYFMCNNGKEEKKQCADKQLFNSETTQCEGFQQVFCGTRPVNLAERNQCESKRDGIYPDLKRSCNVFYQCIGQKKAREANCPNSLKFNAITSRCDVSSNIMPPCGTYSTTSSSLTSFSLNSILALFLCLVSSVPLL